MGTSGFEKAPPLALGRAVGQVLSVNLDLQECVVKIGPAAVDGVTWYGEPPEVGVLVTMTQTASRIIINGAATEGSGGGGGGGAVQQVVSGLGVTVGGTVEVPIVSANRVELGEWFADRDTTYASLEFLDARVDAIQSVFVYAGTYDAATRKISSVNAEIEDQYPLPPPDGYAPGVSFREVPGAPWNDRHFFIVGAEAPIPTDDDGILALPGSIATVFRVGDWIISDGATWTHLAYSSRSLLASSIIFEGVNAGLNKDTVQKALDALFDGKVNVTGGTITGPLTVQGSVQLGSAAGHTVTIPAGPTLSISADTTFARQRLKNIGDPLTDYDAATRKFVTDADTVLGNKTISAGNGLGGGGKLTDNPTLNVNAGFGITVDGDAVRLAYHCAQITDWNSAVHNGYYMAPPGSANAPAASLGGAWVYGVVISHNASWVLQRAWHFASNYPSGLEFQRWRSNGVWSEWRRSNNYVDSYGDLDGLVYNEHNAVRRFAMGYKNDSNEWRVQCYDGAGNFTRSAIRVLPDGRVLMRDTLQSGTYSINPSSNQNTTKRIGFDVPFSTTPQVTLCPVSGVVGSTVLGYAATGIDTGGFTANILRTNSTDTSFMWIATAD